MHLLVFNVHFCINASFLGNIDFHFEAILMRCIQRYVCIPSAFQQVHSQCIEWHAFTSIQLHSPSGAFFVGCIHVHSIHILLVLHYPRVAFY